MNRQRYWILVQLLVPLLPAAALLIHACSKWSYTGEELGTVLSYARTVLQGEGIALQPGAAQSWGFASPLWLLVCVVLAGLNLPLISGAKVLSLLCALVALYMLPRVSARLSGRQRLIPLDLLPSSLLAVNPTLAQHAASGVETSLLLLLLTLGLLLFNAEEHRFSVTLRGSRLTSDLRSVIPLGLLMLAGPLAPLLVLGLFMGRLLARVSFWRMPLSSLLWLGILPLVGGLILVGSYILFADPISSVLTSRQVLPGATLGQPATIAQGWNSLSLLWETWGLSIPLAAVAVLGLASSTNYWSRVSLLLVGAMALAGVVVSGGGLGDQQALPLLLATALLFTSGLLRVVGWLWPCAAQEAGGSLNSPRAPLPGAFLRLAGTAALLAGLLVSPVMAGMRASRQSPPSTFQDLRGLIRQIERIGKGLGWSPSQLRVLTSAPGLAALQNFQVVDASGLTDPAIRRYMGNRRPLELQQLIFSERRPDVLIERGPWKNLHGFTSYPEARRLYIPLKVAGPAGTRVRVSRRLFLEPEPWPDLTLRWNLGRRLWLLGARARHGRLELLWTVDHRVRRERKLSVKFGDTFETTVKVGPSLYPLSRWRAGEIVRQIIPVPPSSGAGQTSLRLSLEGRWITVGTLDATLLRRQPPQSYDYRLAPHIQSGHWEQAELMASLSGDPAAALPVVRDRILKRTARLLRQGYLLRAARQLSLVPPSLTSPQQLPRRRALARQISERALARALEHMRLSRWPLAFPALQAAALTAPSDPWILRRLEEARRRMPAESRLIEELELEIARRALALNPTPHRLARVMAAHLQLKQFSLALVASMTWRPLTGENPRTRYLRAEALSYLGNLDLAHRLTSALLIKPNAAPRRCPSGPMAKIMLLHARLRALLHKASPFPLPDRYFAGAGYPLGQGNELLAHCARWRPGHPLEVDLYIYQPRPSPVSFDLVYGSRRERVELGQDPQKIRRVRRRLSLPPARYPVQVLTNETPPLEVGTVVVGPESTFGFELPSYVSWRSKGDAFGPAPMVGRSHRKRNLFGYVGERFADSLASGYDQRTGSLTSPLFRIRREYLMMLMAGGDAPSLGVDLLIDGRKLLTIRGQRSEVLRPVFIPVAAHQGRWARLIIRDGATGHWGHLAVDEIRQINGPAPGRRP